MCDVQNQILEVFWWFDDQGKGVITRNELARVLRSLSPDWDDKQVDRLVHLADRNSDGLIKYREFVSWLMGGGDAKSGEPPPGSNERQQATLSEAEAKQLEAQALADSIARDSELAERAAAEANDLLEAALPALDAATEALDSLEDQALVELASCEGPPPAVAAIAACLCALAPMAGGCAAGAAEGRLSIGDFQASSWAVAQALLCAPGLRSALREYNKDGVRAEQVEIVLRHLRALDDLASDAGIRQLQAASPGAYTLLLWVRAVVRYFQSAQAAGPKFELVNTLHQGMWRAEAALNRINAEVEALTA